MEISYALMLIDEYIQSLEGWELNGAYQSHVQSFDRWLREYGCGSTELVLVAQIIQGTTGYSPVAIATLEDAGVVRAALYGVCNAEVLGRRRAAHEMDDPPRWAIANVEWVFKDDGDDPDKGDW
jgi:hypothetical protein